MIWNVGYAKKLYWDGRSASLEEQGAAVLASPNLGVGKDKLDAKAKELEQEADLAHRKTNRFDLGEVFLEIALVITSITLLSGRRVFWYLGLVFGSAGIVVAISAMLVK